jgi:hypothetical protein
MRGAGCRIRWNLELARSLWDAGVRLSDIAEQVGATDKAIRGASVRWEWPRRSRPQSSRIRIQPRKRCPGCLAVYNAEPDDNTAHCFAPVQSIYLGAVA